MHITVVIPCFINHLSKLINLLESLELQTRPPNEVIVSCSSTDDFIFLKEYIFPVKLYIHKDKKKCCRKS
jgi:hypothetical protein